MAISSSKKVVKSRVLVADDHPLLRAGVSQLINRQEDLVCCGEAHDAASTQTAVATHNPDLLLLDLRLGHGDGLEFIKSLKSQFQNLAILVFSQLDEKLYAERALRAGALGYVMKENATDEVLTAIRTVLNGDLYVSRSIAVLALHKSLRTKTDNKGLGVENLTDRELQVFQLLGAGMNTRQIAEELSLSQKTIETHRENIKQKLGLQSAPETVRYATAWVQGSPPLS